MSQCQRLLRLVDGAIGPAALGVYLHGSVVRGGRRGRSRSRWWIPGLAIVIPETLAGDHPLTGPPPADLLDPVPAEDTVRASVAGIPDLLDDLPGDTRNVVLTFARIWATLATGEIMSKDAAAGWALARLPPEHQPVLRHARQLYRTCRYSEETWSQQLKAQVTSQVDALLAEIGKLSVR